MAKAKRYDYFFDLFDTNIVSTHSPICVCYHYYHLYGDFLPLKSMEAEPPSFKKKSSAKTQINLFAKESESETELNVGAS